jgi:hypothetical protein
MVTLYQKLYGVAERGDAFDGDRLATHETHLHKTAAGASSASHPDDFGALSRLKITQTQSCAARAVTRKTMLALAAFSPAHRKILGSLIATANDSHLQIHYITSSSHQEVTYVTCFS